MASTGNQEENDKKCISPDDAHPTVAAYLKVFLEQSEGDVEEITYPIMEGEDVFSRDGQ